MLSAGNKLTEAAKAPVGGDTNSSVLIAGKEGEAAADYKHACDVDGAEWATAQRSRPSTHMLAMQPLKCFKPHLAMGRNKQSCEA